MDTYTHNHASRRTVTVDGRVARAGPRPQESKGTLIRLKLDLKDRGKVTALRSRWSATVSSFK